MNVEVCAVCAKDVVVGYSPPFFSVSTTSHHARRLAARSKGLTELALADIAYPSSYTFRPGFLYRAERSKPRLMETIFGFLTHNVLSRVLSGAEIHVRLLAKSIVATAAEGDALLASKSVRGVALRAVQDKGANMTIVSNLEAIRLAR